MIPQIRHKAVLGGDNDWINAVLPSTNAQILLQALFLQKAVLQMYFS